MKNEVLISTAFLVAGIICASRVFAHDDSQINGTRINKPSAPQINQPPPPITEDELAKLSAYLLDTYSTTTTTTTVAPTSTKACIDLTSFCVALKNSGYCTNRLSQSYMQNNCYLSCSNCAGTTTPTVPTRSTTMPTTTTTAPTTTTPGICSDKNSNCDEWSKLNYCSTGNYLDYMRNNCELSCKICTGHTTTVACVDKKGSCNAWKQDGYCTGQYANYMATNCRASCTQCGDLVTTTTAPQQCEDNYADCVYLARQGVCKDDYSVTINCRASCGLCSNATTTNATTSTTAAVTSYNGHCGVPFVSLNSRQASQRIIGGRVANYGSHPWLVSIRLLPGYNICGGTLVSHRHIITAAHCFKGNTNVALYFGFVGKYRRPLNEIDAGEVHVTFSRILVHPLYNNVTFDYDIAIITLSTPVQFSNYVRPACLPRNNSKIPENKNATIAGWGDTIDGSKRGSDTLQQTNVQVIDNDLCNAFLSIYTNRSVRVTSNMFCAGYEVGGRDACKGDSGGPLVIKESTYQILYGVVSWGNGCGRVQRPGVYTRVPVFVDWILTNLI